MTQFKSNSSLLNHQNTRLVLGMIWRAEMISRADLAKRSGLSAPTVSRIVDRLIQEGLVRDEGTGEASSGRGGGRPPNQLSFRGEEHRLLALELGGGRIRAVLTDLAGRPLGRAAASQPGAQFGHAADAALRLAAGLLAEAGLAADSLLGVGLAIEGLGEPAGFAPEALDGAGARLRLGFPWPETETRWHPGPLAGVPCVFANTGRALAGGASWFGHGARFESFLAVEIGHDAMMTGIVLGGRPVGGTAGLGGGLGHLTMAHAGEAICRCGNRGCLEALVTGRGLEAAARRRLTGGAAGVPSESAIHAAARAGDPVAVELLDEAAGHLGLALAGAVNLVCPEAVLIGGASVEAAGPRYLERIERAVREHALGCSAQPLEILPLRLGDDTSLLGAASLVIEAVVDLALPLPAAVA